MTDESLIILPRAYQAGAILGHRPSAYDATKVIPIEIPFTRNSVAMRRNKAGLWEQVAANVPRLNWNVGGTEASWLNEPFATNIALGSQLLDLVTYWLSNPSGTIADQGISPLFAASSNVHSWLFTASSQRPFLYQNVALVNASVYTFSFNCESITGSLAYDDCVVAFSSGTAISSVVIKNNGVVKSGTDIVTVGLIEYTFTCNYSGSHEFRFGIGVPDVRTGTLQASQPQLETGSVATSPIITAGSAVTRVADNATKSGISALIGQTEGTFFINVQALKTTGYNPMLFIDDGSGDYNNRADIACFGGALRSDIYVGGALQANTTLGAFLSGFNKIAMVYKPNSVKLFLNGALSFELTPALFPALSMIRLSNRMDGTANTNFQLLEIFKTAISDAEAIALTTI